jgi:hypothetical protein
MKEETMRLSFSIVLLLLGCAPAASAPAQTVAVAPFSSVQLRNGGEVRITHGDIQRVSAVEGDTRRARILVENGRLRIDRCRGRCSHREPFLVEIVTPRLDAASVEEGGRLIVQSGFPRQAQLTAAVANGGVVDARTLEADQVTAAVAQGGIILARPGRRLEAAINQGGVIHYWGDPAVSETINGGGVVERGRAEDVDRPLAELMPLPQDPGPLPPIPPLPKG